MAVLLVLNGKLALKCDYEERYRAKSVAGARWNPEMKVWEYPLNEAIVTQITQIFPHAKVSGEIRAAARVTRPRPGSRPGTAFPPLGEEIEKMQEFGNGFVPRYGDYALMIDCTVEALDKYGDWLGAQVMAWKPSESIEDLRDLLAEVREVLGARNWISGVGLGEDWYGIRMDDLPSAPIPEGIDTSYPIWAMSTTGGVLTGECADRVETILDVIQTQNPDLDEDDLVQREDLPEPVRTWYVEHNTIAPDDARYVWETGDEDEEPKIRWGDVLKEYGLRVWGITP